MKKARRKNPPKRTRRPPSWVHLRGYTWDGAMQYTAINGKELSELLNLFVKYRIKVSTLIDRDWGRVKMEASPGLRKHMNEAEDAAAAMRDNPKTKRANPALHSTEHARASLRYRAEHWGKGGKQKPRELACANPFAANAGPVVVIGRLVAIEYETDKLGDGLSVYRHEVTSRDATIGSIRNGRLVIGGEKIRMTLRGIVG